MTTNTTASLRRRPTSVVLGALVAIALLVALAPGAAAQTQQDFWNRTERTFYLHLAQYCDREVSLIRWIDEFDWKNDLDGCGGNVLDPTTRTWRDNFPSFAPLHANVSSTTSVEMHIFILSRAVDQTTVQATLDLGYASCEGSDGPEIVVAERATGYHEFIIPCSFQVSGTPVSTARPNLTVTVSSTATYGYGTEGDHASYLTITGVEPAPPKDFVQFFTEADRPRVEFDDEGIVFAELPDSGAKSPAAGPLAALAILVALALWVQRRRG